MANKKRRLKPAAFAIINTVVFAVCTFTFYQIGKHQVNMKDTAAVVRTESSADSSEVSLDVPERLDITMSSTVPRATTTESTTTVDLASWENQWHYWDVPWANAYQ